MHLARSSSVMRFRWCRIFPSTDSGMKILRDALGGIENREWRWKACFRCCRNDRTCCECCAGGPGCCLISYVTSTVSMCSSEAQSWDGARLWRARDPRESRPRHSEIHQSSAKSNNTCCPKGPREPDTYIEKRRRTKRGKRKTKRDTRHATRDTRKAKNRKRKAESGRHAFETCAAARRWADGQTAIAQL